MKKYGLYFLLVAFTSDFLLPFILGIFVPEFNPMVNLTSYLGEVKGNIGNIFKFWETINGILMLISLPAVIERFKNTSEILSKILASCIGVYAFGDCILTAIFDHSVLNFGNISYGTIIHRQASFFAFVGILIGMVVLVLLYSLEDKKVLRGITILNFLLALISTFLYVNKRKAVLNFLNVNYRGLWQKINLFLLFAPFILLSLLFIYEKFKDKKSILSRS